MNLSTKPNWLATLPENVVSTVRPNGQSAVLLVCEHASLFIPEGLKNLGLSEAAAQSHIAWDPGALAVAERLSAALDATLITQKISRLVYDCNRPPESDQAMRTESEIYQIAGNTGLTQAQRDERTDYIYRPFRHALAEAVKTRPQTVLVTIHSFTPVYNGEARAVEVGILHDRDPRLADAMLKAAAQNPAFKVKRNAPYGPKDGVTHTLKEHAVAHGSLNVMIEVRNDLLADDPGIESVATWLESLLASALKELDGIAWSGITEDYTVGWADVTDYFLTNNISGAWAGSFFANQERYMELPEDLKTLLDPTMDHSHYYRQWWYWGGEADLRINGTKMQLTSVPDEEWQQIEDAALVFRDEIAAESETKAKAVQIFKDYNDTMNKAGKPYRY